MGRQATIHIDAGFRWTRRIAPGQRVGDVIACTTPCDHVTFAQQQVVSRDYGVAGDPQHACQLASRRQSQTRFQSPVENRPAQLFMEDAQKLTRTGWGKSNRKPENWIHDFAKVWIL